MNTNELYACSYKEVILILSLLPDEDWNKIPQSKKDFYFNNMNKDYKFNFDYSKNISEQELLTPSKAILANIYKEFLASDDEKKEIIIKEQNEFNKIEEEKRKKYDPDNIFKNIDKNSQVHNKEMSLQIIEKKVGIYEKLLKFIKNLFKKY